MKQLLVNKHLVVIDLLRTYLIQQVDIDDWLESNSNANYLKKEYRVNVFSNYQKNYGKNEKQKKNLIT